MSPRPMRSTSSFLKRRSAPRRSSGSVGERGSRAAQLGANALRRLVRRLGVPGHQLVQQLGCPDEARRSGTRSGRRGRAGAGRPPGRWCRSRRYPAGTDEAPRRTRRGRRAPGPGPGSARRPGAAAARCPRSGALLRARPPAAPAGAAVPRRAPAGSGRRTRAGRAPRDRVSSSRSSSSASAEERLVRQLPARLLAEQDRGRPGDVAPVPVELGVQRRGPGEAECAGEPLALPGPEDGSACVCRSLHHLEPVLHPAQEDVGLAAAGRRRPGRGARPPPGGAARAAWAARSAGFRATVQQLERHRHELHLTDAARSELHVARRGRCCGDRSAS